MGTKYALSEDTFDFIQTCAGKERENSDDPLVCKAAEIQEKSRTDAAAARDAQEKTDWDLADRYGMEDGGQVFLLMNCVRGSILDKKLLSTTDEGRRQSFYLQLVEILAELRKLEFPIIGSLHTGTNERAPTLGPLLSMHANILGVPPPPILQSASEYVDLEFDFTSEVFFEPASSLRIDNVREELYAFSELKTHFQQVVDPAMDHGPFVLNHLDLRMPNIIVDEQLCIQAVIDWEFAATVPLPLFTPPSWITGYDSKETGHKMHMEFRKALRAKAEKIPICQQLEIDWYGASSVDPDVPISPDTARKFCVAHIMRKPGDAVEIFYDFMDNDPAYATDETKAARLARFLEDHPNQESRAQEMVRHSVAYAKHLADSGLFETRWDRLLHMKKSMVAQDKRKQ